MTEGRSCDPTVSVRLCLAAHGASGSPCWLLRVLQDTECEPPLGAEGLAMRSRILPTASELGRGPQASSEISALANTLPVS